ncbi:hypothetical protein [Konateibacter massiliensis]|uniref:hypothetical protein n=1 Tax=Konateibacter massiliensis TaxID=2002841 RepID=UPI000C149CAC|nr:hypothetical protein [Konateibacter massiliensis]
METTNYSEVYSWFLDKVTAYSLTMFNDTEKEDIVYGYMRSACAKFKCCKVDLTDRDDELRVFNNTLNDEILDIISETMVVAWLQPKLNNEDNLVNSLSTKDYSLYSPANLLAKLTDVFTLAKKNSSIMVSNYSFSHGKLPKRGGL